MKIETTSEDIAKMTTIAIIGTANEFGINLTGLIMAIKEAVERDLIISNSIKKSVEQYDNLIKSINATNN